MVSVSDPAEIPNIYGFNGKYIKVRKAAERKPSPHVVWQQTVLLTAPQSNFYHVIMPYVKGKVLPGLFATQDENLHRVLKRPIANIYSMSNLLSFEAYVDSTMRVFFDQLDKLFVMTGNVCDLDVWLQLFAFDVMGEITFSKRLGFLERAEDVDGIMASIWAHFYLVAPVGQMPWLDSLWTKNPIFSRLRPSSTNSIVAFTLARMAEKQEVLQKPSEEQPQANSRDFLSRFMEAKAKDPSSPPWAVLAWATSNIIAGSDTTAIVLRTIFYNLLKHPDTLRRLLSELDGAAQEGRLSELVTWKESRNLPYLNAVIKEAGRIHPPFGLPLERIVPPEGAEVCGQHLRGGTIVGISAWVVHRDKATFGEDCNEWNPDRWIHCTETKRKAMEHALLTVSFAPFSLPSVLPFVHLPIRLTPLTPFFFPPSSSAPATDPVSARTSRT
ncbi:hypothetical protein MMC24_005435 [Lignoscripta atroalba]|nr:hypothetical protein [Lignoscripta atroalba]